MGRIPEYQRSSFQQTSNTNLIGNTTPVADAIGRVANAGFEIAQKRQRIQDETYVTQKAIELENRSDEIYTQWQKDHADDPVGKVDDLKERLGKVRDELINQAPSGNAQTEFGNITDKYYHQVSQHATKWQDEQLANNTIASTGKVLDSLQTKILRAPHPQNFETLLAEGDTALGPLKEAAGAKVAERARAQFASGLSLTMFESLIEKNNISGARTLLNSQHYDEHLGADGIQKVQRMMDARIQQNEALGKKMEDLKNKNPWDYYLHQGGTANPIAFDPSADPSGVSLRNSLLKRQEVLVDAKQKYGIDLNLFTPQETDAFIKHLKATGTNDTVNFFSFYDKNITDEQKGILARQVFEREPSLGIALSISNDSPSDAQKIITGTKLLREEKGQKIDAVFTPKAGVKDLEATFDTYAGNATEDADFRRQWKDAARAHYTTMALRSNKSVTDFDPELFKESMAATAAPVFDVNGRDVFSFRDKTGKFVESGDFEDFTGSLTDEQIQKHQGDVPRTVSGAPINMEKAGSQVSYVPTTSGKYHVLFQNKVTLDKDGKPFVLDMKKLYDNKPPTWWEKVWK